MIEGPNISGIAALIGDPARANMLTALMSGKALTASELALEGGVMAPTASSHLQKLVAGGLISVRKQGRHKYYTLAEDDIAELLERLMGVAARTGQMRVRTGPKDPALRKARACYGHLAGHMGVQMLEAMLRDEMAAEHAGALEILPLGHEKMRALGVEIEGLKPPICKPCLDWSARKNHLGGQLGVAVFKRLIELGWMRRLPDSRVVAFSAEGVRQFEIHFPKHARTL
ncbi:MAG TPA: ArsR family transcriptional regulator [Rhodobacteraceae bacterium]|nr:ArsR family transcriptional regulator [Paracoccaceae bacterium]